MIKEFAQKHMKSDEVKLDQDLNRQVWAKGKTNPPRKLRVKMVKDEDSIVTVSLYEDLQELISEKTDRYVATSDTNEIEKDLAATTEQQPKTQVKETEQQQTDIEVCLNRELEEEIWFLVSHSRSALETSFYLRRS